MADAVKLGEQLPAKPVDSLVIEQGIKLVLEGLGQGAKEEVMRNTPRRVSELYQDFINAAWCDIEIPWKCFANEDSNGEPLSDDLIMITDVHYISMCEHHLAPAFGVAHFCYVPDKRITGYSKVKKALNYIARQPQLNERILKHVLDGVEAALEPKGCGLVLHSTHSCLICKSNAPSQEIVTIQGFRGVCRDEPYRTDFQRVAYMKPPLFGA